MMHDRRFVLAGLWSLIVAAGAAGAWAASKAPPIDRDSARLTAEARRTLAGKTDPAPPADDSLARFQEGRRFEAEARPIPAYAGTLLTRVSSRTEPPVPVDVDVQPLFAKARAVATLDGVTVTWTAVRGDIPLKRHERPIERKPAGLRIERRLEGGAWELAARPDPTSTSWTDLQDRPEQTYQYRAIFESPARSVPQDVEGAAARTPSNRRARLTGGDATVAIVRVETYQRSSRSWTGTSRTARPGDELWPGGWTLSGLAFKGFTLVARVDVGDGRTQDLTTKD